MRSIGRFLNVLTKGRHFRYRHISPVAERFFQADSDVDVPTGLGDPDRWRALTKWIIWLSAEQLGHVLFPESPARALWTPTIGPEELGREGTRPGIQALAGFYLLRLEPGWAERAAALAAEQLVGREGDLDFLADRIRPTADMERRALDRLRRSGAFDAGQRELLKRSGEVLAEARKIDERRGLLDVRLDEYLRHTDPANTETIRSVFEERAFRVLGFSAEHQRRYDDLRSFQEDHFLPLYRRIITSCAPGRCQINLAHASVFAYALALSKQSASDLLLDLRDLGIDADIWRSPKTRRRRP